MASRIFCQRSYLTMLFIIQRINVSANFRGDPHITTLDEKKYTFNGLGEYMLLKVETENVTFSLQGRTERAITANGTVTNATIFSAFAAKDNTDASVQVELSANKSGNSLGECPLFETQND